MIPDGLVFPWIGQHDSIPSKWVRETSLDGKYAKGWGNESPNTTGGAANHTHSSPAHSHTVDNHTHTYQLSEVGNGSIAKTGNSGTTWVFNGGHYHNGTSGAATGSTSSVAVTYGSCSNDPPYYEVVFIRATPGAILPNDILAYWNAVDVPDNWFFANGNNGTPDLRNKYLKGASTGANSGGQGGSTTNTHDITHGHTASHSHQNSNSGYKVNTSGADHPAGSSAGGAVAIDHVHTVSFNANTDTISEYVGSLTPSEVVEPSFKKLLIIQKKAGGKKERGLIGLWLGSVATIPKGWVKCDGQNNTPDLRDYYPKIANDSLEIGITGGSNSHTHAPQSHSHASPGSHSHSGSVGGHPCNYQGSGADHYYFHCSDPNHTLTSVSSSTVSYGSATTSANSSSNEPPYRTAVYVQYQRPSATGMAAAFMI